MKPRWVRYGKRILQRKIGDQTEWALIKRMDRYWVISQRTSTGRMLLTHLTSTRREAKLYVQRMEQSRHKP